MKSLLKSIPVLNSLIKWGRRKQVEFKNRNFNRGETRLNVNRTFPLYWPSSGGDYQMWAPLTIQCINQLPAALGGLSRSLNGRMPEVRSVDEYCAVHFNPDAETLRDLFLMYGSDKATTHDYWRIYAAILKDRCGQLKILEIGLGTNNPDVVSNMGRNGRPGASLRAFRDFAPNGFVFGADVDRRVLFKEDRIETYFVDQTDVTSLAVLGHQISDSFDLMIDDGLHSPNANLHSLAFFIPRLKIGGVAVIEDIPERAGDLWTFVAALFPLNYTVELVKTKVAYMFIVTRVA